MFLLWCFVYFAIFVIGNIVGTSQQFTFFHRFEWTEQCRLSVYPFRRPHGNCIRPSVVRENRMLLDRVDMIDGIDEMDRVIGENVPT